VTATARLTKTAKPTIKVKSTVAPTPTVAPEPTMSPFVQGRHVYDNGKILSANSATTAEALAAHIETVGGGRVVIYTAANSSDLPDHTALASDWHVDGMLLEGSGTNYGNLYLGATLQGKLSKGQTSTIDSSPGMQTLESWMLSSLARADAAVSGTNVFDGAGVLDATGRGKAETAAKDLSDKLKAPVYVDISLGGDDPSNAAFFNGAHLSSDFDNALVIALAVSGKEIAGYIDSAGSLFDAYKTGKPWTNDTMSNQTVANGDVQAALLAAIGAVQNGSAFDISPTAGDILPVVIFVVVVVAFSITAPFLWGPWLMRKLTGTTGPIKGGLPSDAIVESITDTGTTVSMPEVGPEAPEYKFGLQVNPPGGAGVPYSVEVKALVPRLYIPMVVPGARVGVLIDPTNPMKLSIDFSRINQAPTSGQGADPGAGMSEAAAILSGAGSIAGTVMENPGGVTVRFDAQGNPVSGVNDMVGAVQSGAMPTIKGKAATILATGTHGTAVITTCQPLGKTVRDLDPSADPSRLDDPIWLFTLDVSLAGMKPFPAMFDHRVPIAKLAQVAPGVHLSVAVDQSNPSQEVAIDWDKSPIGGPY
jgi:hypothetical protein